MLVNWKDIAVLTGPDPASEPAVEAASALASRHDAALTGLCVLPHLPAPPADDFARGAGVGDVIARRRLVDQAQARDVAGRFADHLQPRGLRTALRVGWHDGIGEEAVIAALYCDLIVMGRSSPARGLQTWSAEALLFSHGAPMLLVPATPPETIGDHVVIAWNGSREARRAVNDALPLLTRARTVSLLVVNGAGDGGPVRGAPVAEAVRHLACHGVTATPRLVRADGRSVAESLEHEARHAGGDLIVAGGYSHARAAELVFGGVTRALLAGSALPVFLSR